MFKTILVPTDGSDHANKAIDLAAGLAQKFGARIILLHLLLKHDSISALNSMCKNLNGPDELINKLSEIEDLLISSPSVAYGPVTIPVPVNLLEKVGKLVGEDAKRRALRKGAKNVDVQVQDGPAADTILAAAEHENADVIIMGSRGLGHLSGMLMGSVSHKVNNLSKCTCITVK